MYIMTRNSFVSFVSFISYDCLDLQHRVLVVKVYKQRRDSSGSIHLYYWSVTVALFLPAA